jgi:hypothetical protein
MSGVQDYFRAERPLYTCYFHPMIDAETSPQRAGKTSAVPSPQETYGPPPPAWDIARPRYPRRGGEPRPHFPPAFYDNLSRIWLTKDVLRELERRHKAGDAASQSDRPALVARFRAVSRRGGPPIPSDENEKLLRFAKGGGPDMCDVRGVCIRNTRNAQTLATYV